MKHYEITITIKFELPAPNAMTILEDVQDIISPVGVDKKMIDVHIKEMEYEEPMVDYDRIPDTDER